MAGFAGLQGAAEASRLGVGSKKRPSRQWAVNEGGRAPVIFRPFLGPGAHGKPPYHRPQVDLDALPNRGRGCSMGCRRGPRATKVGDEADERDVADIDNGSGLLGIEY